MENTVLGNALTGVPEEEEDGEDEPKDSNIERTENIDGEEGFQSWHGQLLIFEYK